MKELVGTANWAQLFGAVMIKAGCVCAFRDISKYCTHRVTNSKHLNYSLVGERHGDAIEKFPAEYVSGVINVASRLNSWLLQISNEHTHTHTTHTHTHTHTHTTYFSACSTFMLFLFPNHPLNNAAQNLVSNELFNFFFHNNPLQDGWLWH